MDNAFRQHEPFFFSYSHAVSTNMPNTHFHDTYEIYYLLSGCRRHLVKNDLFDVYPGDFVLIPGMTLHRTLNVPGEPENGYHSRYLLAPPVEMIPEVYLPLFDTYHYRIPQSEQAAVMDCFGDIAHSCKHPDAYSPYANQAALIKLLTIIARNHSCTTQTAAPSGAELTMRQAAAYIKENCHLPLTLSAVAAQFGFSREYFSTLFKASTGFGFNDYLNQMRISKATTLLLSSELSIAQISSQCGFNDSNYFANVFKRNLGIAPSRFRMRKM